MTTTMPMIFTPLLSIAAKLFLVALCFCSCSPGDNAYYSEAWGMELPIRGPIESIVTAGGDTRWSNEGAARINEALTFALRVLESDPEARFTKQCEAIRSGQFFRAAPGDIKGNYIDFVGHVTDYQHAKPRVFSSPQAVTRDGLLNFLALAIDLAHESEHMALDTAHPTPEPIDHRIRRENSRELRTHGNDLLRLDLASRHIDDCGFSQALVDSCEQAMRRIRAGMSAYQQMYSLREALLELAITVERERRFWTVTVVSLDGLRQTYLNKAFVEIVRSKDARFYRSVGPYLRALIARTIDVAKTSVPRRARHIESQSSDVLSALDEFERRSGTGR